MGGVGRERDGCGGEVHTLRGKKMGNQLIMPALFASIVSGLVLSSVPGYSTASKYPANPWHTPRSLVRNVSLVCRALCSFCDVTANAACGPCVKDHVGRMLGVGCGVGSEGDAAAGEVVERKSMAWSMTTYGVFGAEGSEGARAAMSAWSLGAAMGVR